MSRDFDLSGTTGTLWHLWNRKHGANTDSGDAGFIMKRDDGYEAFTRGDVPRSLGIFDSLEHAQTVLESHY